MPQDTTQRRSRRLLDQVRDRTRQVITAEDAENVNKTLQGLSAIMKCTEEIDVNCYFPGLEATPEAS